MQNQQYARQCSLCDYSPASCFCTCLSPPLLLCAACIPTHFSTYPGKYHELPPIATLAYLQVAHYQDDLRKRQRSSNDAIHKLRSNLPVIEAWKRELCEIAKSMAARLIAFSETLEREVDNILHAVAKDIEAGEREFQEKFLLPKPEFISCIAKALWDYGGGSLMLLACNTDFQQVKRAVDSFLFSLNLHLETELPGYYPITTIRTTSDLHPGMTVNIYPKLTLDFTTPQSKAALLMLRPAVSNSDFTPTIKRGCVTLPSGSLYVGSWSQQNQLHGYGEELHRNGTVYKANWAHGQLHGRVQYVTGSGEAFDGWFEKDKEQGFARWVLPSGDVYTGEWEKGKRQGLGCYEYAGKVGADMWFFGEYVEDRKQGRGVEFDRNGAVYAGQFRNGVRHGFGVEFRDGRCFAGTFAEGVRQK